MCSARSGEWENRTSARSEGVVGVADRQASREFDVVIVGAGFAGLFMLHRVRRHGLTACVFEAGSGVGGTWFWNRYPGARCDVESVEYSYQFSEELQQEWEWTERYAGQPEILAYLNHVADRFDLCKDIRFETRVESAVFDEAAARWTVRTGAGDEVSAQFLVMATGCLSNANVPDFKGLGSFAGETYHTGRWPDERVEFAGKRVGVIGTGSSAIQSVPIIAEEAGSLVVFQRTPAYSVPARNGPLDPSEVREIKSDYAGFRATQQFDGDCIRVAHTAQRHLGVGRRRGGAAARVRIALGAWRIRLHGGLQRPAAQPGCE